MCNPVVFQNIEDVVSSKVNAGEMFTAFDVTKEVRQKVGYAPHREVRQEVHNLFINGGMPGYIRTVGNLSVAPGARQPFVYHRRSDNPANYNTDSPGDDHSDDAVNVTDDGSYKVDARGTLCIPKSMLEACGLFAGDQAYVSVDGLADHVIVSKNAPDGVLSHLTNYTVDDYGNVRVTQHALNKANLSGKEYKIDGDTVQVCVRLAKN